MLSGRRISPSCSNTDKELPRTLMRPLLSTRKPLLGAKPGARPRLHDSESTNRTRENGRDKETGAHRVECKRLLVRISGKTAWLFAVFCLRRDRSWSLNFERGGVVALACQCCCVRV